MPHTTPRFIRKAAPLLAGLFLSACFDSGPGVKTPSDLLAEKIWRFESIAYELGALQGSTIVFNAENPRAIPDSAAADTGLAGILFPDGRSCYYGADWENPGVCLLDDTWDFSPNGNLIRNSGAALCDSSRPAVENGTWILSDGARTLTISLGADSAVFQVEQLTGSALRFSETATDTSALCGENVAVKTAYVFAAPRP